MNLSFLSPLAGLVALAVLAPLVLLAAAERRGSRARTLLGLDNPGPAARLELPAAICTLGALLGLAAAQPVLHREVPQYARRDAEAIVAFDISRWNALSFRSILAMNCPTSSSAGTSSGLIPPPSSS